ncbi:MAG: hypothetical protein R3B96_23635 [Pirellulaceae bacterium]
MGTHQMTERQVLDAIITPAIGTVFNEYVERHGFEEIARIFRGQGIRIEVEINLPSSDYTDPARLVCRRCGTRRSRSTPARIVGDASELPGVRLGGTACGRQDQSARPITVASASFES